MADDGYDDGDEDEAPDDGSPPPSVARHFAGEGTPSAPEFERFAARFPADCRAFAGYVWNKVYVLGMSPESRENLQQETYTRVWAWAKRGNIPKNIQATLGATATYLRKAYARDKGRKARNAAAFLPEPADLASGPDPRAHFHILLEQVAEQLPPADWSLLYWFGVDGDSYAEIGDRLGIPEGTVCTRMRKARARLKAILDPPSEKEPAA